MGRRGNPYFHFQQFSIWQDRCAMKVGVDGILLGAWATVSRCTQILDIGTGTGLMALMAAQRALAAKITALEIDPQAALQARENILRSPWPDRIDVQTMDWQEYLTHSAVKFDLVLSNPPFFPWLGQPDPRSIARQQQSLSAQAILETIRPHLSSQGKVAMIVPVESDLEAIASAHQLFLNRKTNVRPTSTAPYKRSLVEFSLTQTTPLIESITIEQSRHHYSHDYKKLISAFFLDPN